MSSQMSTKALSPTPGTSDQYPQMDLSGLVVALSPIVRKCPSISFRTPLGRGLGSREGTSMPKGGQQAFPEWETNQPTSAANQRTDDFQRRNRAGRVGWEAVRRAGRRGRPVVGPRRSDRCRAPTPPGRRRRRPARACGSIRGRRSGTPERSPRAPPGPDTRRRG